ncbi:MAG: hypothetical protein DDT19_02722 [Syntrophomonadaceae bacterium]|nr:hypothetical protein [Bacillota bacterium]
MTRTPPITLFLLSKLSLTLKGLGQLSPLSLLLGRSRLSATCSASLSLMVIDSSIQRMWKFLKKWVKANLLLQSPYSLPAATARSVPRYTAVLPIVSRLALFLR